MAPSPITATTLLLSLDNFLQLRTDPDKRENVGLQSIFKSVFPIHDYAE